MNLRGGNVSQLISNTVRAVTSLESNTWPPRGFEESALRIGNGTNSGCRGNDAQTGNWSHHKVGGVYGEDGGRIYGSQCPPQEMVVEKNWAALLILVVIAVTVMGNILVILAVSLEKKLQNATNYFLMSLAVADMLLGILVMPVSMVTILYVKLNSSDCGRFGLKLTQHIYSNSVLKYNFESESDAKPAEPDRGRGAGPEQAAGIKAPIWTQRPVSIPQREQLILPPPRTEEMDRQTLNLALCQKRTEEEEDLDGMNCVGSQRAALCVKCDEHETSAELHFELNERRGSLSVFGLKCSDLKMLHYVSSADTSEIKMDSLFFIQDYGWPLPSDLCPIWIYLDVLFSTASIMHLCAISLDRYIGIRNPIHHSRFNSHTKARIKIMAVWTISVADEEIKLRSYVVAMGHYAPGRVSHGKQVLGDGPD
ncbi:hypothetical protein L3Q82_017201 [Scortum barcoo]|uniref:Uncharacterized protein n=1 Tax=Scortum barcoo TaxID=214431 RepID=A0ACB8VLM2_9TELE|nr:hypothetical protein L3Q82_017201 [Scortum barcoo]